MNALRDFLARHNISGPLLVAASGGVDSTALIVALAEIGKRFEVAHINHHLRGADSDADEQFVRDVSPVPVHVADGTLDVEQVRRVGVEAAARRVRYARLQQIRRDIGAAYIVTAHQKNDQAETVLMRLMSGGGVAALRGILPIRADGVIRPLLTVTRAEIERFLQDRNITARRDRSNDDSRFARNRARAALAQLDAAAIDTLAAIADQAREQWRILEQAIDAVDTSIASATETRFQNMPDDAWLRRALLHRHIRRLDPEARDVSAADLARLASEIDTKKRISVTANLELLRRNGEVILRKRIEDAETFELEVHPGEAARTPFGTIELRPATGDRRPAQRFELPEGATGTFVVRNRRQGDRFQPLGMLQMKKLKDFLIDRKIAVEARDRIPLLVWNGAIVWIAGVEISEAFKVRDGAGELYEVVFDEESQEGVQPQADRQPHR